MGILRLDELSMADRAALVAALPAILPVTKPAASPAAGTAAASRPPPVAARKGRRSMPEMPRELFIFGGLRIRNLMQCTGTPRNYTLWKPQRSNEIVTKNLLGSNAVFGLNQTAWVRLRRYVTEPDIAR